MGPESVFETSLSQMGYKIGSTQLGGWEVVVGRVEVVVLRVVLELVVGRAEVVVLRVVLELVVETELVELNDSTIVEDDEVGSMLEVMWMGTISSERSVLIAVDVKLDVL